MHVPRPTTARVLALLEILQTGGTHTAPELARRLGVDERTARRYVEHLVDLEIPVWAERGRHGGYRLAPGFRLPPLMFTDEEALAVMLGLVAGRRSRLPAVSATATEAAIAKIRRVLPRPLGERLDALIETTGFTAAEQAAEPAQVAVLLLVAEAARDRRPIAFDYTDRHGRRSRRTVEPHGVVAHDGRWYLSGADAASGEVRTFRLDRMERPTQLTGRFDPSADDVTARVVTGFAAAPYRHDVSVRVLGPLDDVRRRLPVTVAAVDPAADGADPGWVHVRIRAERLDWVPALLASLDRPFVIESPEALRDEVRALASRLLDWSAASADD